MEAMTLSALMAEYRRTLVEHAEDAEAIDRFHDFLAGPGGLRALSAPGKKPRIIDPIQALRCFHFSQFLNWYLAEKEGESRSKVDSARAALQRFNEWLREGRGISEEEFEENRESMEVETIGPREEESSESAGPGEEDPSADLRVRTEQDFHVPGEYVATLSGEFVITKVQEGILYGVRVGEEREIGPILVERAVSSGHRVGDRIYLSLGKAGHHWNLLHLGPCRSR